MPAREHTTRSKIMMRVTSTRVLKAIEFIATTTDGAYRAQAGGSLRKESGTRYIAAVQQIVYDSTLGENRAALAFFLGVMDGYGILTGEWADWRENLSADEYTKHFNDGRHDARAMKRVTSQKKEQTTMPEPRRVESSSQDLTSETAYNGTSWATHSVSLWIENDSSFYDTACNFAKLDDTGQELRGYVFRLLFDRDALAYEERKRLTRDDVHTLRLVVGDLTAESDDTPAREAFDKVDWARVRADLLA
jgi:hypothetical protein